MDYLLITPPPPKHLWGSVGKGPKAPGCCGEMSLSHNACETNITNLSTGAVLVQEDVLSLQVAVHHLHVYCLLEGWQTVSPMCRGGK